MKFIISLLCMFTLVFSLTACVAKPSEPVNPETGATHSETSSEVPSGVLSEESEDSLSQKNESETVSDGAQSAQTEQDRFQNTLRRFTTRIRRPKARKPQKPWKSRMPPPPNPWTQNQMDRLPRLPAIPLLSRNNPNPPHRNPPFPPLRPTWRNR